MMNPLDQLKALYSFLTLFLESKFPSARRGISSVYAIGAIVTIVAAGGLLVFLLVVYPTPTTSTYP